jgi:RHS repeat-associated protein
VLGSSGQPFGWVGQVGYSYDPETELYFVRARYYDPVVGRWISEDPLGLRIGSVNLYRYSGNNPINAIDPSGLQCTVDVFQIYDTKPCQYHKQIYDTRDFAGGGFRIKALFSDLCCCCEYRQERKGSIKIVTKLRSTFVYGPQGQFEEDEPPYGHRWGDQNTPYDAYLDPTVGVLLERFFGCIYLMEDNAGYPKAKATAMRLRQDLHIEIDLDFRVRIIDVCNNDKVVAEKLIPVKCKVDVTAAKD